jgi:hypothetical protein
LPTSIGSTVEDEPPVVVAGGLLLLDWPLGDAAGDSDFAAGAGAGAFAGSVASAAAPFLAFFKNLGRSRIHTSEPQIPTGKEPGRPRQRCQKN